MSSSSRLVVCLAALMLLACGGQVNEGGTGGSNADASAALVASVRQFGVAERELYDPLAHLTGIVPGANSGLVSLQLEPAGGPAAPIKGDTAGLGVDEVWFDVDKAGSVTLALTDQNLAQVSRIEITAEQTSKVLGWVDATQPQITLQLAAGRYRLRLQAATSSKRITMVFVWFGGVSPQTHTGDLAQLANGNCVACDLAGADLTPFNLRGADLSRSDLRGALLAPFPGGMTLASGELLHIYIGGYGAGNTGIGSADLSAANLSGVNLSDTYLDHANMSAVSLVGADLSRSVLTQAILSAANLSGTHFIGADLRGANLSAASMEGADFTEALLEGATWPGGRVCATGSIGVCR